jgi:hypothetical protein
MPASHPPPPPLAAPTPQEGLGSLVEAELVRADASLLDRDLAATKELLQQHAGALQAGHRV